MFVSSYEYAPLPKINNSVDDMMMTMIMMITLLLLLLLFIYSGKALMSQSMVTIYFDL